MGKKWVEVKASWKPGSLEAVEENAKISIGCSPRRARESSTNMEIRSISYDN